MAADQRKKRLNTASITSSREKGIAKKKKLRSLQCDLNVRSNISLEWDDKQKGVVAKREQIGLTRRDSILFIDYVSTFHDILADVLDVPCEIFQLDNLKEVLSYEVWKTHLSKHERNYLTQFLPNGAETHQVVQELLAGDNFHFGNPFLTWGASLCSGNLHPDAVLHQEQWFKTNKKSYYSELQKYHNGMIGNLLMWKETWTSCKDPDKEIVHKIWRSRKQAERSISTDDANDSRFHNAEEDLSATSESCSWAADEKAGSSDNQNLMRKHEELQKRKGFMWDKYDNLSAELKVVARPSKGEKLHKQNIQCGDGSKYMSYIKVSREQHQRVKNSMKHSSNSIQSRSLNRVLGNLDTFHIQPYEVFEEEERKKLHEHWVLLAIRDLPVAFANWRTKWIKKLQLAQCLEQEMEEKLKSLKEDEVKENAHSMLPDLTDNSAAGSEDTTTIEVEEKENPQSLLQEQVDDGAENHRTVIALEDEEKENADIIIQEMTDNEAAKHEPAIEDDNKSLPVSSQDQHLQPIPSLNGSHAFGSMDSASENHVIMETNDIRPNVLEYQDEERENADIIIREMTDNEAAKHEPAIEDDNEFLPVSSQDQHLQPIPSLNGSHAFGSMDLASDNHVIMETNDIRPNVSEYPEILNRVDIAVSHGYPLSSTSDVWPAVSIPNFYYHSTSLNHDYSSARELSLGHSRAFEEQPARMIDLESDNCEEDEAKHLLHRQSNDRSFFHPYTDQGVQNQNELQQHFYNRQEGLPYHHEHKQTRLDFLPASNVSVETSQFSGHYGEQLHLSLPLELRQKRLNDICTPQNDQEKMFTDGDRHTIPRQECFSSFNVQDWALNTTHTSVPPQSHLDGGELGRNWFSGEHQGHGGWSSLDGAVNPTQSIGNRTNADQSLYAVLSQCNELRLGAPCASMGSTERFIQSGTYGRVGALASTASNVLPQAAYPLDYLSGHEAAVPVKKNNIGWMSMPLQNSALQDSMGNPFLRSWNK